MLSHTPLELPDFKTLIEQVHAAIHSSGIHHAEALRLVIEHYELSDEDSVRLFSAVKSAIRESSLAA
jgi:hypothetical protein